MNSYIVLLLIPLIGLVDLGSSFEPETSKQSVTSVLSPSVKSRLCHFAHQKSPMSKRHLKPMNNRYNRKMELTGLRSNTQITNFTETLGLIFTS